jgi:hypothetical protein
MAKTAKLASPAQAGAATEGSARNLRRGSAGPSGVKSDVMLAIYRGRACGSLKAAPALGWGRATLRLAPAPRKIHKRPKRCAKQPTLKNRSSPLRKTLANSKSAWLPSLPVKAPRYYDLANYGQEKISGRIAPKYLNRRANLRRSWVRICTHMPEATGSGEKLDILELSTAHGAMLEILRGLGHRVAGTDFAMPADAVKSYKKLREVEFGNFDKSHEHEIKPDNPGWSYQPIIESLGLDVQLFDGGQTPYPFEDKSFDIICCYQALEAYAAPDDWDRIVTEFCRIARRAVIIGFNPPGKGQETDPSWPNTRPAWEKLRTYNANGFQNVMFEMEETGRAFHPTACKLVAV